MAQEATRTVGLRPYRAADLPLLHQRIFAPYKLAILVDAAAERGVAPDTVLAGGTLSSERVHDPHALTSVNDYLAACENIVAAGGDPQIPLDVGSRLHLSAYGMYGYALMCSPTMRDFFDFAVRYHLLATPMLRLEWRREGDLAVWRFPEIYSDAMSFPARAFLVRQQMMMTATHVRDVSGADIAPIRALFGLPDTGHAILDGRRLGCACLFDQPAHELHYPRSILDLAPQFANRLTHTWLEETCTELIGRTKAKSSLIGEIYQRLMRAPHRAPSMQSIARELGVTERTLRRRLTEEGIRFAEIADDVRQQLSLRYLQTTRMTADDIAAKVGFTDTANLRRAVKRWTGRTLGQIRDAAAKGAQSDTAR
ncbi:MAG: AraC family transcriptional regulator [Proteobacteria bacterium]|nr:AraC family transcriptional regulator [Pseudomonadota bacterium]